MAPKHKTTAKTKTTVDPKGAVKSAYEYLIGASPDPGRFSKFRLEEIRIDQKKDYLITLSYEVTGEFEFDRQREFKDFNVGKDGTVLWMKIRKP